MTRKEIRSYLQAYSDIKDQLIKGRLEVEIRKNGRKKIIRLTEDAYKLKEYVETILAFESDIFVRNILTQNIINGLPDKKIIADFPVSESTFYRCKRKFSDRVYELFILEGYVKYGKLKRISSKPKPPKKDNSSAVAMRNFVNRKRK